MRIVSKAMNCILATLMLGGGLAALFALAVVPVALVLGIILRGSALSGFVRDGHYYVVAKGATHEVSSRAFRWMLALEWTSIACGALVLLGVGAWIILTRVLRRHLRMGDSVGVPSDGGNRAFICRR